MHEGHHAAILESPGVGDIKRGIAIGIDAGGTKTLAILVDADGREVAREQASGANPWDVGPDAARLALLTALEPLLGGGNVRAVCLGSAGVDRESDRVEAEVRLRALLPSHIVIDVRNDAAAALGLVGPKRPAMVVIAGTGSIVYGEKVDGSAMRIGGHGAIIGDSGSGSALGMAAIRHVTNVLDGSEPRGMLSDAVMQLLKIHRAHEIVTRIQHPDLDIPLVASLAPLVEQAYNGGDLAAKAIVDGEAEALAANAKRLARAIREVPALPVLLVGSIFGGFPLVREKVTASIRQTGQAVIQEFSESVLGAARIARDLALAARA
jgi:glucosamine kinase